MEVQRLTEDELRIVDNPEDVPYLEMIKGMSLLEMDSFKCYRPRYLEHYNRKQNDWLAREMHLIRARPGHPDNLSHDALQQELVDDMVASHNGQRFKVWYVLKYPGFVERIEKKVSTQVPVIVSVG